MYCYKCGKEISESVKFCPHCGTEQGKMDRNCGKSKHGGKKSIFRILCRILIVLVLVPLALFGAMVAFSLFEDEDDIQNHQETIPLTETTEAAENSTLEDGWYAEYGDRYYIKDGLRCAGLHEIEEKLYYFDEEGVLLVNQDVRYENIVLQSSHDGHIKSITYDAIYGEWAEESYRFGNGGSSSILEFASDVKDCDSFLFYLESNGEHGAKVNGNWNIYIRCNGKWEFVKKINYSEPNGSFEIVFDTPKTFDAITAYPTVQGNASYTSLFYLQNVHCIF